MISDYELCGGYCFCLSLTTALFDFVVGKGIRMAMGR